MINLTNHEKNSINVNGVHMLLWDKEISSAANKSFPVFLVHFFGSVNPFLRSAITIKSSQPQNLSYDQASLTSIVLKYDSSTNFKSSNLTFQIGQNRHEMMIEDLAINGHVAARVDII